MRLGRGDCSSAISCVALYRRNQRGTTVNIFAQLNKGVGGIPRGGSKTHVGMERVFNRKAVKPGSRRDGR